MEKREIKDKRLKFDDSVFQSTLNSIRTGNNIYESSGIQKSNKNKTKKNLNKSNDNSASHSSRNRISHNHNNRKLEQGGIQLQSVFSKSVLPSMFQKNEKDDDQTSTTDHHKNSRRIRKNERLPHHHHHHQNNQFEKKWMESKQMQKRNRLTYIIALIVLWLSVLTLTYGKPWVYSNKSHHEIEGSISSYVTSKPPNTIMNGEETHITSSGTENNQGAAPSHIILCRSYLERSSTGGHNRHFQQYNNLLVVEEDERVCQDQDNPFTALTQIFASAFIARAGKHLNLEYRHNCNAVVSNSNNSKRKQQQQQQQQDPIDSNTHFFSRSIQQTLGSELFDNKFPLFGENEIHEICSKCINPFDNIATVRTTTQEDMSDNKSVVDQFSGPECILFPSLSSTTSSSQQQQQQQQPEFATQYSSSTTTSEQQNSGTLNIVLPYIKKHIYEAAQIWKIASATSTLIKPVRSIYTDGFIEGVEEDPDTDSDSDNYSSFLVDPDENDDVVIYLTCANEQHNTNKYLLNDESNQKSNFIPLPFYVYAQKIQVSVQEISIIASSSCASHDDKTCKEYGGRLSDFLKEMYPRAQVKFEVVRNLAAGTGSEGSLSSLAYFSKMINTKQLFCVSGVSCIFPVLATDSDATLIESVYHYPWLSFLQKDVFLQNVDVISSSSIITMTTEEENDQQQQKPNNSLLSFSPFSKNDNNQDEAWMNFAFQDPPSRIESCRKLRGRLGKWETDPVYAKLAQYSLPLAGYAGAADQVFQPDENNLFRKPTTYKWNESVFPLCSIDLLSLDTLCAALDVMSISRIFILGDSLSLQQAQSLWKLLGFLDDFSGDREASGSRRVQCPSPFNINFEIAFSRNDRLMNVEKGPTGLDDKNCKYGYCWPFEDTYKASPSRTLLIANTGAHSHQHSIFYHDFDHFVKWVDEIIHERPDDIVWFRTSVPGHKDCDVEGLEPFKNYAEYVPTITELYSWDKFIDYNDYAARVISSREKHKNLAQIRLLDVYPMTVLRPDGHAGGADCKDCKRNDCLHYSLPGPIDYWNHLMLSNLVDTASDHRSL